MNRVLIMLGLVTVLGIVAAGCKTDTKDLEDRVAAVETQVGGGANEQAAINSSITNALDVLNNAGLHEIDENANDNNTVDAGSAGSVDGAIVAMAAVEWPDELKADADALIAKLQELHDALETTDPATVGPVATEAHEMQHEFSETATNYVKTSVGLPTEEHQAEGETPGATGAVTPEATP